MKNILWAIKLMKRHLPLYIVGFVIMIIDSYAEVFQKWVQKDIIDIVFIGGDFSQFLRLIVKFAIVLLIPAFTFIASAMTCHIVGYNMRVNLGSALLHKIFSTPMKIFQNERTGKYVDMLNFDVDIICEDVAYQGLPRVVQWGTGFLFTAIAIFLISPIALIAILILSFIYLFLVIYFVEKNKQASSITRKESGNLSVTIEENVSSTREVIAYHRQKWEEKIFNVAFKKYFDAVMNEGKVVNQSLLASYPIKWITILTALYFGGSGVMMGSVSIGGFVILYQYTNQIIIYMQDTYERIVRMGVVSSCVNNLKGVFDIEVDNFGKEDLKTPVNNIEFKNVSFKYNQETDLVLNDINLSIPIGQKTAIVGSSGSGKSTIAKILIRFFNVDKGEVLINNTNILDYNYDSYCEKISIVFQEPYMFPDTIFNNAVFGNKKITLEKLETISKNISIDDYIQTLSDKYDTQIGERGTILSGGQRQRLAIVRGILKNSDILILDEATSALDVETEKEIQKNLDELRKGKTTIIIAHRLSTIINSDKIIVLEKGKVIESGTHEELIKIGGVYERLTSKTMEKH